MKKILFLFLTIFNFQTLISKDNVTLPIYNSGTACKECPKIILVNSNKDEYYDLFILIGCNKAIAYGNIIDKSSREITFDMIATLVDGNFTDNSYRVVISNPDNYTKICYIYYDATLEKTILEDYYENQQDPGYYEEADEYFYFRQTGSYIFVTKKADIDVQLIIFCNLSGIILAQRTNTYSVGEFYFDLGNNPAGLYLIRIITNDKQLTKKIVYLK